MDSKRGFLTINEVMAAINNENGSEIDSNSPSELDETTDDSADEVQAHSMANVDPFFQVSVFHSDDNLQQVNNNIQKDYNLTFRMIYNTYICRINYCL